MISKNSSAGTAAQKSSKCSLIQRPAIILAMLLLCAIFSSEAQITSSNRDSMFLSTGTLSFVNDMPKKDTTIWNDTIPIMLLVCDTSINDGKVFWIKAYSKRKGEYDLVDVSVDPNTTTYVGGGIYSTTLLGLLPIWENKAVYSHLEYLGSRKKPLPKNIVVWQSVSVK